MTLHKLYKFHFSLYLFPLVVLNQFISPTEQRSWPDTDLWPSQC